MRRPSRRLALALGLGVALAGSLATAVYVRAASAPAARSASPLDFHLADQAGHAYSLASFPAESVLVLYFGYTTCLRACPTALDTIAAAIDAMGAQGAAIRPVFIDMDPERAAQLSLPLYMEGFGRSFLGLTGTPTAVQQAASAFAVTVERLQFSPDSGDYAMTHVSPIFVMRPGDAHAVALPATSEPEAIAAALQAALQRVPAT